MNLPPSVAQPPTSGQEHSIFKHLNLLLSLSLVIEAHARPNECFANAWRAFIQRPDLFQDAWYIEGWFVIEIDGQVAVNEHAWIWSRGQIIDPSVLLIVPPDTPVFYFPGVARSWLETEALEGQSFPHVRFDGIHGADGLLHAGYKAAREAARRKVHHLALAHTPPAIMRFLQARDLDIPRSPDEQQERFASMPTAAHMEHRRDEADPVLDLAFSEEVAHAISAQVGRCWYNVRDAMLQMPRPFFFAQAIEGWLIKQRDDRIQLIEHGWLHFHNRLIDPTIVCEEPAPVHLEYLPGLSFSWAEVQRTAALPLPQARLQEPPPRYQASCQQAFARAEHLAWQTGLPLMICPGFLLFSEGDEHPPTLHVWEFPVPATRSPLVPHLLHLWEKGQAE